MFSNRLISDIIASNRINPKRGRGFFKKTNIENLKKKKEKSAIKLRRLERRNKDLTEAKIRLEKSVVLKKMKMNNVIEQLKLEEKEKEEKMRLEKQTPSSKEIKMF